MTIKTTIICAMGSNTVIGKDNKMPWAGDPNYKWDMKNFKKLTTNHYIIMGYNTFKSMDFKALPNRINCVISHEDLENNDIKSYKTVTEAIEEIAFENLLNDKEIEIFIIGGEKIFNEALDKNLVDNAIISIFHKPFDGDTKFPLYKILKNFKFVNLETYDNGSIFYYKNDFVIN